MNKFYVYLYTCPIRNEIIYVGKGFGRRYLKHLIRKDCHPFTHRIMWIRKQGQEPIISFLYKEVDEDFALLCEKEAIALYGRKDKGLGSLLNMTDGGEGVCGFKHREESKDKMRTQLGKPLKEETKKKLSDFWNGKPKSVETKAKMSAAKKGQVNSPESFVKGWKTRYAQQIHS